MLGNSFVLVVRVSFVFVYACLRARVIACLLLFVLASENYLVVASLRSSLIESQHRAPPALCLFPVLLPGRSRGPPRSANACYILLGWQESAALGGQGKGGGGTLVSCPLFVTSVLMSVVLMASVHRYFLL